MAPHSYEDHLAESRRSCILRLLEAQAGYSCNDSVLQVALESFGFAESRDKLRTDLNWLAENELVTTNAVGERLLVAHLTVRGIDVARGRTVVPGVSRPSP